MRKNHRGAPLKRTAVNSFTQLHEPKARKRFSLNRMARKKWTYPPSSRNDWRPDALHVKAEPQGIGDCPWFECFIFRRSKQRDDTLQHLRAAFDGCAWSRIVGEAFEAPPQPAHNVFRVSRVYLLRQKALQ
jgi:hypothetical protein